MNAVGQDAWDSSDGSTNSGFLRTPGFQQRHGKSFGAARESKDVHGAVESFRLRLKSREVDTAFEPPRSRSLLEFVSFRSVAHQQKVAGMIGRNAGKGIDE